MKIQKSPYYKDYSKCQEIQDKNPIYTTIMAKIQGPTEGKAYSNIYKKSGPNLSP